MGGPNRGQLPSYPGNSAMVPSTRPAGPPPKFRCDELIYQFPEVWSGDKVEHAWVIHNDGVGPLEILQVQSTCGCTVPQTYDKTIPPGGEGKITVIFNSKGQHADVSKGIIVRTNDPSAAQITLQLKGKVKSRYTLNPVGGVQFGNVTSKTPFPLAASVTITNNTDKPMKIEPPATISPQVAYSCTVQEKEKDKVYEVTVSVVKEKLHEGNNYVPLMLKTGFTDEPELPLPVSLILLPVIQLSTASLAVATPVNATFHREVKLTNSDGPMKVLKVTATDPSISVAAREAPVAPAPVNPASIPGAPAPPPPPVAGQEWMVTVDIPMGWDPPPAIPQTQPAIGQPAQAGYDIIVQTDVKDKPELKIHLFTYPQPKPTVNPTLLVGTLAPQAALVDNSGKPLQIGGATGHVTVTTFFASWCPHCKQMLPILQRVVQAYSPKGVDFNLISLDKTATPAQVAQVMNQLQVTLPYAIDSKEIAGSKYGANKFPMAYVMGKDGVIEAVNQGCPATYEQNLRGQLDALLAGKNRTQFPAALAAATTQPAPMTSIQATPPTVPQTTGPMLVLDTLQQEMGSFKPGTVGKYALHVRNGGSQPLNVTAMTPTAGLTVDPPAPTVLQPNVPGTLALQFNTPKEPGPFHHQLTIQSNDPAKPKVTVALNGTVRKLIEVDPPTVVDFGRRPITFDMPRPAMITWNGEGQINFPKMESSSPKFEAEMKPVPQGPNSFMVWIKAKPPFDLGETNANITITTDCKEQPTIVIPIKLTQPPRIEVVPAAASVPRAARIQEATVALTNNGTDPLHILSVKCSNPAKVRTQFYPEVDGLSYRLKVTLLKDYTPTTADGDKVTIVTDDKQFGEIVVPIKLVDMPAGPPGISQLPTQLPPTKQ